MFKYFSKISLMILFYSVLICGCEKSNQKKQEFIRQHIKNVNQRNIDKYGELIIPDFLMNEDVATLDK